MALPGAYPLLRWVLALLLIAGATAAPAAPLALLDPRHPVDDVTEALKPVIEPQPMGNDRVAPPQPRMIESEYAYSGWLALSLKNAGEQPIDRVLVFSHPALARTGLFGAPLAAPRFLTMRYVEGELPVTLPLTGPANRFALLGVHLEPGAAETIALQIENGSHAIAVQAWEPGALARFDTYLLLAIGLYWGILFAGAGLLFALRLRAGPHRGRLSRAGGASLRRRELRFWRRELDRATEPDRP